jgi:predicted lipoprotein with Yx(FWY)xxD motif
MKRLLIAPALLAVLVAAGCGSSSSTTSSSAPASNAYGGGAAKTTASAPASTAGAATVGTTKGELGTFLVDGKGRTLYLFEKDKSTSSTCSGACAAAWPPLLTKGDATVTGSAKSSELGTTKRSDGTTQVTYGGHPLYTFAEDQAAGDTKGQGVDAFGAEWYVVAPSGKKIDSD